MIHHQEVSALYIDIARQHALAHNVCPKQLLRITPALSGHEPALQKIPLRHALDFWQQVADLCAAPIFGLQAGSRCHLSVYGLFSHLLLSCPTLLRAIHLGIEHIHIFNSALETGLRSENQLAHYSLLYPVDHPAARHHIEFHMASALQLAQQIVRQQDRPRIQPSRVDFCHAPAAAPEEYQSVFHCEVRFRQPRNQMVFAHELLDTPCHAPNTGLYGHLLKLLEAIGQQRSNHTPYARKVRNLLHTQQASLVWPTLESIATTLGMSPSSLKRKLKHEQTCYQTICDDLRYRQAKQLLLSQHSAIGEVALQLGFSSPAAFSRSFKRWSGLSPHDYLKKGLNDC